MSGIYIETSIVSYLRPRQSSHVIDGAHQLNVKLQAHCQRPVTAKSPGGVDGFGLLCSGHLHPGTNIWRG